MLKTISELEGKNMDVVIESSKQRRLKRGGFTKKIFLEKTIER